VKVNEDNIEDDDENDLQKITTSAAFVGRDVTGHVNLASLYNLPRLSDRPPACPVGACPASRGGAWRSVQH